MSKQVYTVTKEGIEYVCSLINQIVTLPSDVIDDLNIATNTTYSSYKLNVDLNNLETNINDRTDKLIASLNKLSKKIITTESEIVDENTLYLLLIDSTNNVYQQWLLIDGSPVMVGTTEMSLDSVYTKDEADVKFGLKTVSDTLVTEVTEIKETIGTEDLTTMATTLKGAINELEAKHYLEVYDLQNTSVLDYAKTFDALTHNYFYANNCIDLPDNMNYGYCSVDVSQDPLYRDITFYCPTTGRIYVNTIGADPDDATVFGTWSGWHEFLMKEDIVTTIDSTSTDDTVPTNKAVYENHIHSGKIPHCENIDDVTLDNGLYYITPATTGVLPRTNMYGMLRVECHTSGENIWYYQTLIDVSVENTHVGNSFVWIRINKTNTNTWNGWKRLCYTTVEDIPLTSISSFYTTSVTGTISYEVKNGVCYVNISDVANTSVGMNFPLMLNILPKPKKLTATTCVQGTTGITTGMVYMNVVGELFAHFYVENKGGYGSFSYPVAES